MIDLLIPEHSYFFGFVQADGHLRKGTRNRGTLSIEINKRDKELLIKFQELMNFTKSYLYDRTRKTNFKEVYNSCCLKFHDLKFRTSLNDLGLSYGKKSKTVSPPEKQHCKIDYIRGLVDGDGAVGYTKKDNPFITLCTSSENIATYFMDFCNEVCYHNRKINRNKRDGAFCPVFFKEDAQMIVDKLYYDGCLSLKRKYDISRKILLWTRPKGMRKKYRSKKWDDEQDQYILNHTLEESCLFLSRTISSIKTRIWRLNKNDKL